MTDSPSYNPIPKVRADSTKQEKRSAGRIACEFVVSSVGKVLDASRSGLRIRSRRPAGQIDDIVIFRVKSPAGSTALKAKVVWTEKRGFRNHESGLELLNTNERQRRDMRQTLYAGNPDAPGREGPVKRVI